MNALLSGDCLDLPSRLSALSEWGHHAFNLVYLDPPFNVGTRFSARLQKGTEQDRHRASSNAHAFHDSWGGLEAFLAMLKPRLTVLRESMAPHATLWLHLDWRTVHDAKVLCDSIFGRDAFCGEIIWAPGNGAKTKGVPSTHQTLLVYTKASGAKKDYIWNTHEPDLREPYSQTSMRMHFVHKDDQGKLYRERTLGGKTYRYYAHQGRARGSIWNDLPAMLANTPLRSETTGYPTQKPLALLERIVRAATCPGDLVVDPMCGSGTTLEAAARLGRRFVGNDIGELAIRLSAERLQKSCYPYISSPPYPPQIAAR